LLEPKITLQEYNQHLECFMAVERKRELRRRRSRKRKLAIYERRAATATVSEKNVIATKIRNLTPGAELIIARMGLSQR